MKHALALENEVLEKSQTKNKIAADSHEEQCVKGGRKGSKVAEKPCDDEVFDLVSSDDED